MLRDTVKNLNKVGIPYAKIAEMVGVQRSHIYRFANGEGGVSFEIAVKIQKAVDEIQEAVKNA